MKKLTILIAAISLVCFTVPAMAVDWNFYGNARMATFWTSTDYGDKTNTAGTDDEDQDLQWDLQGNSRVGATIKAENINARFEFGVNEANVSSRRLFGVWNFGAGKIKVGKDYSPTSQFISGQVFDGDLGLLGVGTQYSSRNGQISFMFGAFEVALVSPKTERLTNMTITATAIAAVVTGSGGTVGSDVVFTTDALGDVDKVLPKIEATWGMSFDSWNFNIDGGFQYYCIEDIDTGDSSEDIDVTSFTLGADVGWNFGPGYVKGAFSYGQNIGDAGWGLPGNKFSGTNGGRASWDGDDDTNDTYTAMGALVVGLKISDMFSLEAGGGVRNDRTDEGETYDTTPWMMYLQSVIALAPGVYVIPEVGYADFDDDSENSDDDAGSMWYLGGKWQINF